MARVADKEKARRLRAGGKTYTEIKQALGVGKGTLSAWLFDMPLTSEQIRQVRDLNPRRIEHFRETMSRKRDARLQVAYSKAQKEIGTLSRRDVFIAGLYLYWGEGTKAARGKVALTNTNPAMLLSFLEWAKIMGLSHTDARVRLHLYTDMSVQKEILFWSKTLSIPKNQFRKPYIKSSSLSGLTYKTGYGHGTCSIEFENMPLWEYITMALKYLGEQRIRP